MVSECPLCRSELNSILYKTDKNFPMPVVKCNACFHVYTLQTNEPTTDLYNDEVYHVVENRNSLFDKILSWESKRAIHTINQFKPSKGKLLDFGCGKGKFANIAKNNGWQVRCIETAENRANYARTVYGLEVKSELYKEGKLFDGEFELVTLFHVLEHLPAPGILLSELIKSNLKTNGLVVIEVPNLNSWQAKLAGRKWMHLDIPRHISHFTPMQLEAFAKELGLRTVKKNFFSLHLGVLGMVDSLLKIFGYKKNIIYQLKNKRTIGLVLSILLVFSLALVLEIIAAFVKQGGITRQYFLKTTES